MTTPRLPPPENRQQGDAENHEANAPDGHSGPKGERRRGNKSSQIPDADACLHALAAMPGLIAMGMVSTAQANAISRIYNSILQHHDRTHAAGEQRAMLGGELMDHLRANPQLVHLFEPLLTDEQMDLLMEDAADGSADKT
jgi:hypothetical protein